MSDFLDKLKQIFASLFKTAKTVGGSAYTWIIAMSIGGVAAITYGAFLIAGEGISLIVLGIFLLVFMALIARGAANG